jgi:hypothetical protein
MEFCVRIHLDASVVLLTESKTNKLLPFILGNTGLFLAVMAA